MSKKLVVSIIGGGIRGIIPCLALVALEKETGKLARESIDFIGGTSTGALLVATVIAGIPAETALKTYTTEGSTIFSPTNSLERNVKLVVQGHQFDNQVMRSMVAKTLGDHAGMTFNDSSLPAMVTAGNMLGDCCYFTKDRPTNSQKTGKALVVDACVASACATTFHAPLWVPGFGYFCDGGCVSLADPVYQVCVEAFSGTACYGDIDPADAVVISLGTGTYTPSSMPKPTSSLLSNITWVTDSLVGSSESLAEQATDRQWPGVRRSFNPALPVSIDEADVDMIPTLVGIGTKAAAEIDWKGLLA